MNRAACTAAAAFMTGCALANPARAQQSFTLLSPAMEDGAALPDDLKCPRDHGDGASPPLAWSGTPEGTQSLALVMYHYPRGTVEGVDPPSHYWLLWNISPNVAALPRGNPQSIGNEGSDKDGHATGYTPPCSPKPWFSFSDEPEHQYFIEIFALAEPVTALPEHDDRSADWKAVMNAIDGKVIASSRISFWN